MTKPILYSYFRSTSSWRVRIALALKGIEYETKPVHLLKDGGHQHKEDYTLINAMHQVPSLIIDGVSLTQSLPIVEYLEETHKNAGLPLLPRDPVKRAQSRMIAEMINSGIQPIQNLSVLQYVGDEKKMEWGHYWIEKGFTALESTLRSTAGTCCVGDDISIADLCLVPQVSNALRFNVDLSSFPTISKLNEHLSKHAAFIAAHPSKQPDCPDDLRR